MFFEEIINAKLTMESDRPLMQKDAFPVSDGFRRYLQQYRRSLPIPVSYSDLLYYNHSNALRDPAGKLTHWEAAVYDPEIWLRLSVQLVATFTLLKRQEAGESLKQPEVQGVDFCEFGNSIPFRISLRDRESGNIEIFYVKLADASRIYGLELEHLLSPDHTSYLYYNDTLVEAHIAGIPGDLFIKQPFELDSAARQQFAGEFVQFNERCFTRLLGDMRSYNFVVIDSGTALRIRAIDFDQQSYEGKKNLYFPQFYKENFWFVQLVLNELNKEDILRCQHLEQTEMKHRVAVHRIRLTDLLDTMDKDELSESYKIVQLGKELNAHFKIRTFSTCVTMGAIVKRQLTQVLSQEF